MITIQRGSTTLFANLLDSAILKAQNGDYLYLPGGIIGYTALNNTIVINKSLKIFGAGYHPDSSRATGPTQMIGSVVFAPGSDGSLITGVNVTAAIQTQNETISGITIVRCSMESAILWGNLSNFIFRENIVRRNIESSSAMMSSVFDKNIVYGTLYEFRNGGITFTNNIFCSKDQNQPIFNMVTGNMFQNNIFLKTKSGFSFQTFQGNIFNNNLFVADSTVMLQQSSAGNIYDQSITGIFTTYTPSLDWNSTQNFHLKTGSKGIKKGTDGKDIGIYGTNSPFKDGGMPFNPHIRTAVISSTTGSNGKLSINFSVSSQNQ